MRYPKLSNRLLVSLLLTLSVGAPIAAAQAAPDPVTREVEAFLQQYAERLRALDVAGVVELFSAAPEFRWAEAGRTVYTSRTAIAEGLRGLTEQFETADVSFTGRTIVPLSRDLASVFVEFSETFRGKDGGSFGLTGSLLTG